MKVAWLKRSLPERKDSGTRGRIGERIFSKRTWPGRRTKAETLEEVAKSDCVLENYSLADFKTLMLGKKTTLVTYYVQQRMTCGGKEQAQRLYASSIYVAPSGPLLRVFHQETAASK